MTTFSTDFPSSNSDVPSTYYYPLPVMVSNLPQWPTPPYQQESTMDTRSGPVYGYPEQQQAMINTTPDLNNSTVYGSSSTAPQSFLNKDLIQNPTWYPSATTQNTTPLFDETLQDCMNMLSSSNRTTAQPQDVYPSNNPIAVVPSLSEPLITIDKRNEVKHTERKRIKSMSAVFDQWSSTPAVDWHLVEEDPEALPRLQKPRYKQDDYNPKWVRFSGHLKEGYCDTCGRWLQLKNSAYWYHKQFYHGISSVSGQRFLEPLQQRLSDEGVIEGLCHQCGYFVPICNGKRQKNSLLWYKHAHKCHVYNKPEKYTSMATSSHHSFPL